MWQFILGVGSYPEFITLRVSILGAISLREAEPSTSTALFKLERELHELVLTQNLHGLVIPRNQRTYFRFQ